MTCVAHSVRFRDVMINRSRLWSYEVIAASESLKQSLLTLLWNRLISTSSMSEQGRASSTLDPRRGEMEKGMSNTASAVLTEFRLEGKLCDVVIKVGDVKFDAHKIILCSCSPYFWWVEVRLYMNKQIILPLSTHCLCFICFLEQRFPSFWELSNFYLWLQLKKLVLPNVLIIIKKI